ncbi:hypothetical protein AHOG_22120 [Actinoalloteichus hoggarensis]|uniref:Uncharacterized protein n=1 Tax=Actinoalloteichus hoggarensis TaxID=1470176 RepID=A0A221W924_9PSEU|nr:hypothetical protein AHOG_22120 [Actinoalloteichus hoggarensis]
MISTGDPGSRAAIPITRIRPDHQRSVDRHAQAKPAAAANSGGAIRPGRGAQAHDRIDGTHDKAGKAAHTVRYQLSEVVVEVLSIGVTNNELSPSFRTSAYATQPQRRSRLTSSVELAMNHPDRAGTRPVGRVGLEPTAKGL